MGAIVIDRASLLYDISGLAYVVADIREGERSAHSLHQVYDICGKGNIDRVDSVLVSSFTTVALMLRRIATSEREEEPGEFRLLFRKEICREREDAIREAVKEYLVASVLADWLSLTLPEASGICNDKVSEALSCVRSLSGGVRSTARRLSPF